MQKNIAQYVVVKRSDPSSVTRLLEGSLLNLKTVSLPYVPLHPGRPFEISGQQLVIYRENGLQRVGLREAPLTY